MKTVHIGELIKSVAKDKKLTDEEIAIGVNLSRSAVQRTYSEVDMSTAKLRKFSEFLEYDFFSHLTDATDNVSKTEQIQVNEPVEKYATADNEVSLILTIPRAKQHQIMRLVFS
jgi:transcriptional regulator with XRE-family HTH domain